MAGGVGVVKRSSTEATGPKACSPAGETGGTPSTWPHTPTSDAPSPRAGAPSGMAGDKPPSGQAQLLNRLAQISQPSGQGQHAAAAHDLRSASAASCQPLAVSNRVRCRFDRATRPRVRRRPRVCCSGRSIRPHGARRRAGHRDGGRNRQGRHLVKRMLNVGDGWGSCCLNPVADTSSRN